MPALPHAEVGSAGSAFERVVALMRRLRAPGGCPWDRQQTFDSIRAHTLEETYEVLEAISDRDWPALREELGDLLLQVVFYAEMAQEEGYFDIADVLATLSDKLVRRHPHVFEDADSAGLSASEALGRWERAKAAEKSTAAEAGAPGGGAAAPASLLGSAPAGLPAMEAAAKLGRKASAAGFDWPDASVLWQKVEEELGELRQELGRPGDDRQAAAEEEFGDLLFTLSNLARHLQLDPEAALLRANRKFRRRFVWMEREAQRRGQSFERLAADQMEALWREAKQATAGPGPT